MALAVSGKLLVSLRGFTRRIIGAREGDKMRSVCMSCMQCKPFNYHICYPLSCSCLIASDSEANELPSCGMTLHTKKRKRTTNTVVITHQPTFCLSVYSILSVLFPGIES